MGLLDEIDLRDGDLPPWIVKAVAVTRPLTTSGIIAIPVLGSFTVGLVAAWDHEVAMNMADASTTFLKGIPDLAYGMIATIALGYTASKSVEAIKAPAPTGGTSPEAAPPPAVDDFAPRART